MIRSLRPVILAVSWLPVAGALLLAALVRDQPWQTATGSIALRVDALSALFALITLAGVATLVSTGKGTPFAFLAVLPLLVAYAAANIPLICGGYLLFAAISDTNKSRRNPLIWVNVLAPAILLTLGWIWWSITSGAWRYDDADAVGTLQSWSFILILLAALLGSQPLLREALPRWVREAITAAQRATSAPPTTAPALWGVSDVWAVAWLYPLLRLYSLGPWNAGWSFGALLAGCAVALWCARVAADAGEAPASAASSALVGMALACGGLSSGAGIAACSLALIAALVIGIGLSDQRRLTHSIETASLWLLSGALPITLPFVVIWLAMGAAAAGGVLLAAGAFWLVGLGNALAVLRLLAARRVVGVPTDEGGATKLQSIVSPRSVAAVGGLMLGIIAPVVVQWPVLPVARQLQGGLSPYGDLVVWPWLGIATVDSGRQQVAIFPSLAVAGLMLVLCALAWLLARLFVGDEQ